MSSKPKLKVGFDLDGVLLYNPARMMRPVIAFLKKHRWLVKRKKKQFFVPRSKFQQWFWWLLHKSSLFVAPGYQELKKLVKEGKIEAYLITGRFKHLEADFQRWLRKMGADEVFKTVYLNQQNQQPHLFKEQLIEKLDLDVFVEDNWDIVDHLQRRFSKSNQPKKIFWVSNLLDLGIKHPYKFLSFKQVIKKIKQL
ncbi:MAG: hypothetical protein GF390_00780 [Candidatus Pacebacteria bacterium]|nr:hypothetical protein [Candidatus Paceibacterota bacterium]